MTTPVSDKENQWSDYWNNDGAEGEVFVSAGGTANPELSTWWQSRFEHLSSGDVVDLACGAGSVFAHLPPNHNHRLYGADISPEALALMRQRIPGVTTTVCSADDLPYADGQFNVVCSQFGVEYAGAKAFEEAARVLAPNGRLLILCHYSNGYIDSRNQAHLEHARSVVSSRFIGKALTLTRATFSGKQQRLTQAVEEFVPAEKALSASCEALPAGIHFHLYTGFRQLYERRAEYAQEDITNWLESMEADVEHNVLRLEHMCRAASNTAAMDAVTEQLKAMGCRSVNCVPMTLEKHDLPLAWELTATR